MADKVAKIKLCFIQDTIVQEKFMDPYKDNITKSLVIKHMRERAAAKLLGLAFISFPNKYNVNSDYEAFHWSGVNRVG